MAVDYLWGKASKFSIVRPDKTGNDATDGTSGTGGTSGAYGSDGFSGTDADALLEKYASMGAKTVRLWADRIKTVKTYRLNSVWRKFDICRITSVDDGSAFMDVAVTREVLIPIRSKVQKYIGGGSYVKDPEGLHYQERLIHSFVHLTLLPPSAEWEVIQSGLIDGEWPKYPNELFKTGAFASSGAWAQNFGGEPWSR